MKTLTTFMLAAALIAPAGTLWASAGDAALAPTATPAPAKTKKHHGHHHKKTQPTTPSNASATTPQTK